MSATSVPSAQREAVRGVEHWTHKGDVRLFLYEKLLPSCEPGFARPEAPILLLLHGSSMSAVPTFDLQVPGRPEYSVMDYFARLGYDVWALDNEGYGRSDKRPDKHIDVATSAADVAAAAAYIAGVRGDQPLLLYGVSSGALKAGVFAQEHPHRVRRLILDAFVWTGAGSATLAERRQHLDDYRQTHRRPLTEAFIRDVFTRDDREIAYRDVVEIFARETCRWDDSVPTGTTLDYCTKLPLVDPARLDLPVMIFRGEYSQMATIEDLLAFYQRLPHPNKLFVALPGVAYDGLKGKNCLLMLHYMHAFFSQPESRVGS
jgi:pimeloyl-ACP methyl ester carboxylesterase